MNKKTHNKKEAQIALKIAFSGTDQDLASLKNQSIDEMVSSIQIIVDFGGLISSVQEHITASTQKDNQSLSSLQKDKSDSSSNSASNSTNISSIKKPFWPLEDVKRILSLKPIRLKCVKRKDGKGDWANIGFSLERAKSVIEQLSIGYFIVTHKKIHPPVDEYHLPYSLPKELEDIYGYLRRGSTYLYLKIFIENGEMVVTESFHWGDPK